MGAHAADGTPVIVALPTEIDMVNAERVYDQLYAALISGAPVIIADFTATIFCDSAGLHRLVMIHQRAAAHDAQLWLVVPPGGSVRHVIELLGLDQRLPVYSSVAEATALLKPLESQLSCSYSPRHDARRERRGTAPESP